MYEMNTRGVVALALQFLLPLLVGLLTKQSWPPALKAVLLLALTAVGQFLVALQDYLTTPGDATTFAWQALLYNMIIGFVVSVAVHFGLWKPTGVSATAQMSLVNDGHSDDYPARVRR